METIEDRVNDVIALQLGLTVSHLKPESRFTEDLDGDSLDQVEIVIALEDEFSIVIGDEEADKIQTVQQAIDYVRQRTETLA